MTLKECVLNKFELYSKDDAMEVIAWLEKALNISKDTELPEDKIESICDRHYEPSKEDMFNWFHEYDETPSEIHNASSIDQLDNVLVLKNGSCYFWYDINGVNKVENPYRVEGYDKDNDVYVTYWEGNDFT